MKEVQTLDTGPYCLVSYEAAAYETGPLRDRLECGGCTKNKGSDRDFQRHLPSHDQHHVAVYCAVYLNYSQYIVHCLDDVGAWSYYCPKYLSTNLSCSRILENVTSDYSESYDVEYVLNGVCLVSVASI